MGGRFSKQKKQDVAETVVEALSNTDVDGNGYGFIEEEEFIKKKKQESKTPLSRQLSYDINKILTNKKGNNPCEKYPRITIVINAHGRERPNFLIPKSANMQCRVFSIAGKLGTCGFLPQTEESDKLAYFSMIKEFFSNTLIKHFNNSTYLIIKYYLYKLENSYLNKLIKKKPEDFLFLYDPNAEGDKEQQRKEHFENVKKAIDMAIEATEKNEHVRTYAPVINKFYEFVDEGDDKFLDKYAMIIHSDIELQDKGFGETYKLSNKDDLINMAEQIHYADAKAKETSLELIEKYSKDRVDEKLKIKYLTLLELLNILYSYGYKMVNIIDFSCRSYNERLGPEIIAEAEKLEQEGKSSINRLCGGKSKRKHINKITNKRKSRRNAKKA